jgi:hypothetical protein
MKLSRHIVTLTTALATCALVLSLGAVTASAHRAAPHLRVYKGTGTVTAVDSENDVFSVNFTSANRALRNALGGDLSNVSLSIDENTIFSINGDESLDTSDLCEDDTVSVVIKTRSRLSGHDLTGYPAAVVTVQAEPGECEEAEEE